MCIYLNSLFACLNLWNLCYIIKDCQHWTPHTHILLFRVYSQILFYYISNHNQRIVYIVYGLNETFINSEIIKKMDGKKFWFLFCYYVTKKKRAPRVEEKLWVNDRNILCVCTMSLISADVTSLIICFVNVLLDFVSTQTSSLWYLPRGRGREERPSKQI